MTDNDCICEKCGRNWSVTDLKSNNTKYWDQWECPECGNIVIMERNEEKNNE